MGSARSVLTAPIDDRAEVLRELEPAIPTIVQWGHELARRCERGQCLIIADDGGAMSEARRIAGELVWRCDGEDSAALAIDDGPGGGETLARQVAAGVHAGDVVILLSSCGRSDLVRATRRAHRCGAAVWAITRPEPDPLVSACDSAIALTGSAAAVQNAHAVALHMLSRAFDAHLRPRRAHTE